MTNIINLIKIILRCTWKIVKKILKEKKIKTLLDVGCGPVSMLREISSKNLKCYGFDLTQK